MFIVPLSRNHDLSMHQSDGDHNVISGGATSTSPLTVDIDDYVRRREADWIHLRRHLHRHPEPSGEEFQTSELILAHLTQHGIQADIAARGVGVVGELPVGQDPDSGPVIALRADIDALRMADHKSLNYASRVEGCAHACGHDVHTTIMLAASETLMTVSQLDSSSVPSARIRLIFQAAEETCKGAQWMVEDGALKDVQAILGVHVDPLLRFGEIGICYGTLTAQVDEVAITVRGQGGHSARPHDTSDPIAAAAMLVSLLYQRLPRSTDTRNPSVFTIGQIHGGTAPNVIPDSVELNGSLRSVETADRKNLLSAIRDTCRHFGDLSGNSLDVEFRNSLGSVRNSELVARAFERATRHALGDAAVVLLTQPSMGGEDFAVYLDHVPGAQVRLGCAGDANWPLLHSPVFDVDEQVIGTGARVVSQAALQLLQHRQESEFQISCPD